MANSSVTHFVKPYPLEREDNNEKKIGVPLTWWKAACRIAELRWANIK